MQLHKATAGAIFYDLLYTQQELTFIICSRDIFMCHFTIIPVKNMGWACLRAQPEEL